MMSRSRFLPGLIGGCGIWFGMFAAAAELSSPSQTAVNSAIGAPLIRFNRNISGGAHTNGAWNGGASISLAVASYAGNTTADARLLEQIRYTLTPGNEPTSNGGYPSQHEKHVTGMFVIVKHTPRIWDQLTASEKTKIDLIMKATFVASAFTTGDNNPFIKNGTQQYSVDGDSNLHRDWNPNYREGMIGGVLVGMAYFGGPGPANAVLTSYNHSQFLSDLSANTLPNIYETYNWKAANPSSGAPTGTMIQNAVADYRYYGYGLTDYIRIYEALNSDTYQRIVTAGLNNGAGINGAGKIASGAETLPNLGASGMLKEFDSSDAGGARSSLIYAYDGFRPHMANQLAMIVSGFWPKGTTIVDAAVARQNIGNTDLWYKAEMGYYDYYKGTSQGLKSSSTIGGTYGFAYNRSTWEDVLKPYHELPGVVIPPPSGFAVGSRVETSAGSTQMHVTASAVAVLNGLLPTGSYGTLLEGPVVVGDTDWWRTVFDNGAVGWIQEDDVMAAPAAESMTSVSGWQNLPLPSQSGSFIVSFNMTAGASGMDGVTGLSISAASGFIDLAVAVRFWTTGVVDARNGSVYSAENVLAYQPGVQYRVMLTVDVANHTYSAVVTPAGGLPVVIASNYAFRTEQSTVNQLANLAVVATSGSHSISGIAFGPPSTRPSMPTTLHLNPN